MKKFFIILAIIFLLLPSFCLAEDTTSPTMGDLLSNTAKTGGYSEFTNANTIPLTVAKLLRVFFSLLGVIFVVLIIYAGFLWMTAGGNEEQITKAKSILKSSIIGLVIIIAAYGITYFVTAAFTYAIY